MLTSVQQEKTEFRYLSLALNDQIKYWVILLSSIEPMQILTYEFIKASTVMKDGKQKMGTEWERKKPLAFITDWTFSSVLQKHALVRIGHTNKSPNERWNKCLAFKYSSDQTTKKLNTNNKFPSVCFWNSDAEGKRKPASVKEPIKCHGQQEVNIAAALSPASSALWGWSRRRSRWRRGTGSCCRSLCCLSRGTARRSLDADRQTP